MQRAGAAPAAAKPSPAKAAPKPASRPVAPPRPEPEPEPAFDGLDNAAILADLESAQAAVAVSSADACPGCGALQSPGAMICMSCGFNKATGRAGKVKVSKEGAGAAAVAGAASKVLIQANPIAWVAGGVIGGAIGAAVWAFVAYQFHFEISYIAIGVGILTGAGVQIVARDNASEVTGVIASIIAVLGGKYATASLVVESLPQRIGQSIRITDDDALVRIATDIAEDYESKGHRLNWPRGMNNEEADEKHEFPRDVWGEAEKKWRSMKPPERETFKRDMEEQFKAFVEAVGQEELQEAVFTESFSMFDVLWFILAVCAAFGVGSGYGIGGSDD